MFKSVLPTYYLEKLYTLEPEDLLNKGIKTILCDLDNTIVPYYAEVATDEAKVFVDKLINKGLNFFILSNNHEPRVSKFCSSLNNEVKYSFETGKPGIKKLKLFLEKHNLNIDECIIIGDQLLTDCLMGNRIGMKSLLVEPACKGDLLITKPNRFIDKRVRKHLKKKKMLKSIKED